MSVTTQFGLVFQLRLVSSFSYFDEREPDTGLGEGGGESCGSYWTVFTGTQGVTYDPRKVKAIWGDMKAFDGNEV